MTSAHHDILAKFAAGERPLNRAIRAMLADNAELRRQLADERVRTRLRSSQPEVKEARQA